jgi:hypothetical protein
MGDGPQVNGVLIRCEGVGPSRSEATKLLTEGSDGASLYVWFGCALVLPADAILDVPDTHVLSVEIDDQERLLLTVESGHLEAASRPVGNETVSTAGGSGCCTMRRASVGGLRWLLRIWRSPGTAVPDDNVQRPMTWRLRGWC